MIDLVSMWSSPALRRCGVGRRLVGAVLEWARDQGAVAVELWVVRNNEPAQRLYESIGFRVADEQGADAADPCGSEVRMRLVLPA